MAGNNKGTDIGYRTYVAAFAVMLIIVVAAVCILSGCLDKYIFKAEVPASGTENNTPDIVQPAGTGENENSSAEETDEPVLTPDTEEDTTISESTSEAPEDTTEKPEDTEKEPETTTEKPEVTTKPEDTTEKSEVTTKEPEATTVKPEETTKEPEDTTKEPESTTEKPEDTTEEASSDIRPDEIVSFVDENLIYEYSDKKLTITGYAGHTERITVAKSIDDIDVNVIGANAFEGIGVLSEVKISAGVTKIESGAMKNCKRLEKVYIPTSVKEIASDVFEGSDKVVIHGKKGSYAEHFAADNGLEFVSE